MYRRFYAAPENITTENITLDADETRHLRDVLRLRAGAEVQIFDGTGNEFRAVVENIGRRSTGLKIISEILPTAPASPLDLTLAAAVLKGEKFDLVVQKAVELGIKRLVPLTTKRADVKLKGDTKKTERWRRIALEAAKQSGRADLMQIAAPSDFDEFIKTGADEKSDRLLFAERGGENLNPAAANDKIIAITGAEGGWEDAEIAAARQNNWQIVTFGGRILRAETAAIAVATILQHRFGDLR